MPYTARSVAAAFLTRPAETLLGSTLLVTTAREEAMRLSSFDTILASQTKKLVHARHHAAQTKPSDSPLTQTLMSPPSSALLCGATVR
jgi:hypothetical protein